jgi:hypothetical protein
MTSRSHDPLRSAARFLGQVSLVLVAIAAVLALTAACGRPSGLDEPAPPPSAAAGASGVPVVPVPPGADAAVALRVADPRRVDVLEVYPQAKALALRLEPGASLVSIRASHVRGGTLDLTGDGRISMDFEFKGVDPTKPPGQDSIEKSIGVEISNRIAVARVRAGAHRLDGGRSLPDPECPTTRAWRTAVESGVADNAVATLLYYDNRPFSPASPTVWSLRVDGHDEMRREIDGRTGALVKRWDQPSRGSARR